MGSAEAADEEAPSAFCLRFSKISEQQIRLDSIKRLLTWNESHQTGGDC